MTNTTNTQVFEIKIGRKWSKVRATSFTAIDNYCSAKGIDWRLVGMMSAAEIAASNSLEIVA